MLTDNELVDAFLTEKTVFLGEPIFEHSEELGRFYSGKIIKIYSLKERGITCVMLASGDGVVRHVYKCDFKNLFNQESLRDKLGFSLASTPPK